MKVKYLYIENFKNLKDFEITIDSEKTENVILGKNATGKSNFFEALILIFKSLDLKKSNDKELDFDYEIQYECTKNDIRIEKKGIKKNFIVKGKKITESEFYKERSSYLPKNLFTYYSGVNKRVESYFDDHQKKFYDQLIKDGVEKPERPFFFARLIHSLYVMLAFYSFKNDKINDFLKDQFGIIGIESILFKIQIPEWAIGNKNKKSEYFWKSGGTVGDFLEELYNISLAPIKTTIKYNDSFRNKKPKEKDGVYLFIKDTAKLQDLAKKYLTNRDFFSVLESTYISDLIHDIKIKVKKEGDGKIYFQELSEGEQQLLVVLGLLIFTGDEESLILLDEPDTHLNPRWKWDYIDILNKNLNKPESTQILMTTHDPLVIGGLEKDQILIFSKKNGKTIVNPSDIDVKGLGVAGILTSDLFELPTTLDKETQSKLDEMRKLQIKRYKNELSQVETKTLALLEKDLLELGISKTTRDPLYEKFLSVIDDKDYQRIIEENVPSEKIEIIKEILKNK